MSIPDILRNVRRFGHASRAGAPGALVLGAFLALSACAPRQAVVESEPGRPGPAASVGEAALGADLERLAAAQAEYEEERGYYAARTSALDFTASSGVRVDVIQGDRGGWSAVASSGGDECALYVGDVRSPRAYVTRAGVVECR